MKVINVKEVREGVIEVEQLRLDDKNYKVTVFFYINLKSMEKSGFYSKSVTNYSCVYPLSLEEREWVDEIVLPKVEKLLKKEKQPMSRKPILTGAPEKMFLVLPTIKAALFIMEGMKKALGDGYTAEGIAIYGEKDVFILEVPTEAYCSASSRALTNLAKMAEQGEEG